MIEATLILPAIGLSILGVVGLFWLKARLKPRPCARRIRLERQDFIALCKGEEIEKDGAKIILADIGYNQMINDIYHHARRNSLV